MVKTDQQALKDLLEQKVGTSFQQRWIIKLLWFDFNMEYKSGKGNKAADPLSRMPTQEDNETSDHKTLHGKAQALNLVNGQWWETLSQAYNQDPQLKDLINQYHLGKIDPLKYQFKGGFLFYKEKDPFRNIREQQEQIMWYFHSSPMGGHTGSQKTHSRLKRKFFWHGMRKDIRCIIKECEVCQRNKTKSKVN